MALKYALAAAVLAVSPLLANETGHPTTEMVLPAASPKGISAKEMAVLKKLYRWSKEDTIPKSYTLSELHKIIDDCADNTLEREDYDYQVRKVAMALMVVGDKAFAKELDGRAVSVQKEAAQMLKRLWKKYKLRYPATEAIANAALQSE